MEIIDKYLMQIKYNEPIQHISINNKQYLSNFQTTSMYSYSYMENILTIIETFINKFWSSFN